MSYLFNKLSTADDYCGICVLTVIAIVARDRVLALFEVSRYYELELPGAFFPDVINAGNPTPCRIG